MDVMLEQAREEARLEEHRARTRMKDVPVAGDPGAADRAVMQRRKAVEARTAIAARPFDARAEVGLAPNADVETVKAAVGGRYAHVNDPGQGPGTWAEYQWRLTQAELDVARAQLRLLRLRRETGPCGLVDDADLPEPEARYAAGGTVSATEVRDRVTGRVVARYPYGRGDAGAAGRWAAELTATGTAPVTPHGQGSTRGSATDRRARDLSRMARATG